MPANPEIEKYIYDAAVKRGMDPQVALRVARAEALNVFDPTKPDLGGDDHSSFGMFQLHYGGLSKKMPNPGLGDEFTRQTGLDARDPSTWRQQVDFSLDHANRHGWKAWMGATAAGVKAYEGLSGSNKPFVREDPRQDTPSYAHPIGSQLPFVAKPVAAEPVQKIAETPVTTPVDKPYVDTNNPWSGLGSGLASSVARGNTGLESPDMAALPAPVADFASATPEGSMAPISADAGPNLSPLADIFKTATIGVDPRLNVDQFGRSLIRRQYG